MSIFFTGCELIIGGDFNCVESALDKRGGNTNSGFAGKIELTKLKSDFQPVDIWRQRNPRVRQITWTNAKRTITCRLDKFLVSHDIAKQSLDCTIKPFHLSDHDIVFLSLDASSFRNKGPCVWRLNTSVLYDSSIVQEMNAFLDEYPNPLLARFPFGGTF